MDASQPQTAMTSRKSKAWEKTKKFFASLGEPPIAEYDRRQAAKKGIKTDGREAYGRSIMALTTKADHSVGEHD